MVEQVLSQVLSLGVSSISETTVTMVLESDMIDIRTC